MRNDEPIVRHLVPFGATFTRSMVVAVQFGAECQNGYYQPVPRLLNLTPDLDLCIEHRTDPVKCFAELATKKVLDAYESIEHYQVSIARLYLAFGVFSASFLFFL